MSNLFSVSRKFEDFVNDLLDEEVSELDELSDDDNTDVDPDYSAETLNEEEDSEEESSSKTSNTVDLQMLENALHNSSLLTECFRRRLWTLVRCHQLQTINSHP